MEKKLQQHFKVQNPFIRAVDARNIEMARFDLSGGPALPANVPWFCRADTRTCWKLRQLVSLQNQIRLSHT
jgi:stress response protein SCP2